MVRRGASRGLVLLLIGAPSAALPSEAPLHGPDAYAVLIKREALATGLPVDIADAVMAVESGYDASRIGGVGEIGLMQVRPATAGMLGFTGSLADLAKPEINIHFGVAYLASAWHQANGDLCRALMKYRAGHHEETMTPLSVAYCLRAKAHLASLGSPYAGSIVPMPSPVDPKPRGRAMTLVPNPEIKMSSATFWAIHNARVQAISASIERRWRKMAAR